MNSSNPVFVCNACRKNFSNADRETIDKIIRDCELENDTTGVKEVSLQRLKYIADIYRPREINPNFNTDVNKTHYGMEALNRTFRFPL